MVEGSSLSRGQPCGICLSNPYKYKCPACGTLTCSLGCVKRHKVQNQCSGEVDAAEYVPMSDLKENAEVLVQRDYNFLLKLGRQLDVSKSDTFQAAKPIFQKRKGRTGPNNSRFNKKQRTDNSFNSSVIKKGDVSIVQMPVGMQRAKLNKTYFDKNKQQYVWTVEWIFLDCDSKTSAKVVEKVLELHSINDLLDKHKTNMDAIKGDDKDCELYVFLKKVFTSQSHHSNTNNSIIPVDKQKSLKEVISGETVLEYPTLYVSPLADPASFEIWEDNSSSELSSDSTSDSLDSDSSEESDEEVDDIKETNKNANNTESSKSFNNEGNDKTKLEDSSLHNSIQAAQDLSKISAVKTVAAPLIGLGYESDSDSDDGSPEETSARLA